MQANIASVQLEVRGGMLREIWPPVELDEVLFEPTFDGTVKASRLPSNTDRSMLLSEVRACRDRLAAWVAFHGLAAQEFYVAWLIDVRGERIRAGAFDIRLSDNKDWAGQRPLSLTWDVAQVRDFWIERILGPMHAEGPMPLANDPTCIRSAESFMRAVAQPDDVLRHAYLTIEHIQKRLGGRCGFNGIGLDKKYVDYVMSRANKVPNVLSRHAHDPKQPEFPLPEEEIIECLKRARQVLSSYAAHLPA